MVFRKNSNISEGEVVGFKSNALARIGNNGLSVEQIYHNNHSYRPVKDTCKMSRLSVERLVVERAVPYHS